MKQLWYTLMFLGAFYGSLCILQCCLPRPRKAPKTPPAYLMIDTVGLCAPCTNDPSHECIILTFDVP